MSRHELEPREDRPDVVSAVVGWDRPFQTFFARVFFRTDEEPDEGEALIWVGTEPGEILTAEAAIAVVAAHAVVPTGVSDRLKADMQATIGIKDSDHQAAAKRRLFGSLH